MFHQSIVDHVKINSVLLHDLGQNGIDHILRHLFTT